MGRREVDMKKPKRNSGGYPVRRPRAAFVDPEREAIALRGSAKPKVVVEPVSLIADTRVARGWSQEQLGQAAGVSMSRISRVERGYLGTEETMKALADALGLEFIPSVPAQVRRKS